MSARMLADGSCEVVDIEDRLVSWPSLGAWANAWLDEWRTASHGPSSDFIHDLTEHASRGVIDALVVLADHARTVRDGLAWVGAGPLEDLVSHSGNGPAVIDDLERAVAQNPPLKAAFANVWLGKGLDPVTRARLVALGARDLTDGSG